MVAADPFGEDFVAKTERTFDIVGGEGKILAEFSYLLTWTLRVKVKT
jgi:hypothetical protein